MVKPLCPILMLGFDPPEEGQRDLRRCNQECALYDVTEDVCAIQATLEGIRMLSNSIDSIPEMLYETIEYANISPEDEI